MKERIYKIMNDLKVNQKEFAQMTGIATSTLSNIFNGRTSATLNHLVAIHDKFPELNLEWLLNGKGDMYEGKADAISKDIPPTLFDYEKSEQLSPTPTGANDSLQRMVSGEEILETVKEVAKQIEKPQRNVVEIRVFFDDGTYDVFSANRR